MNNGSSARSVVETALLSAISVILVLASFYVPVFYLVGYFLWPIPLAMIYIRHGIRYSLSSIFVTGVLTAILSDPVTAITSVVIYSGVGLVLGYSTKKKESIGFTILTIFAVTFISILVTIQAINFAAGYDVLSSSIDGVINSIKSMKDVYINSGMPKETAEQFFNNIPDAGAIKSILPSFFAVYSIITAFLSYWMFEKIAGRLNYSVKKMKPFSELYIPTQFSMVFMLLIALGYLFLTYSGGSGDVYMVNVYFVFSFIFSIGGLAVVTFFLRKRGIPKAVVFMIGTFLIMSAFSQILVYVGLADYIFNFRKLDIKRRYTKR